MRTFRSFFLVTCIALAIAAHLRGVALAASSDEAAKLRTSLTPFGAERAASADGRIPAWTGVVTRAGYRDDPFAKESPVVTITAKNAAQYADHLTDGTKALLAKYPDYKIVVYPTHRTAVAPQWVYDATFQNALHGRMNGYQPQGVYGGIPFPLPATGVEAMWNHILRWRAPSWQYRGPGIQTTADGRHVTTVDVVGDWQMPYYFKNEQARFNGEYWLTNIRDLGPPIRTGEAIVGREDLNDDKTRVWVYLAGQRRTRELPNACCDTPTPATAGVMAFDELDNWTGRLDRYDWKIVGKKELYVPYNDNGTNSASDLVQAHFLIRIESATSFIASGQFKLRCVPDSGIKSRKPCFISMKTRGLRYSAIVGMLTVSSGRPASCFRSWSGICRESCNKPRAGTTCFQVAGTLPRS